MKNVSLLVSVLFLGLCVIAQHHHHDAPFKEDDIMLEENVKKAHPELADKIDAERAKLEKFTAEYVAAHRNSSSRGSNDVDYDYIIPVVFHVLHQGGPENVTDTEIHDAMRILNEDFQMTNDDISDVNARFTNIVGDAKIEFRLARLDPDGNPTNGIDRINTPLTNNAGENSKLNPWPRNTYLNVWIVNSIGSGAAGYTFLPSSAHWMPSRDGIILLYTYFASVRTGNNRRSRALTHEVGHWLNLPHPWGGTNTPGVVANCSDDDGVFDTPNTVGWTSCDLNGFSCGSFDNVQNFMDYSYCSNMFTEGQVLRMQAALRSNTAERRALVSEANNRKAGVLDIDIADFNSNKMFECTNTPVQYTDQSLYGAISWEWEFEGGTPSTSTAKNPSVSYARPGKFKVKLKVTDAAGNTETKEVDNYITINKSVGTFLPYEEGFENAGEASAINWIAQNEDDDDVYWQIKQGVGYEGDFCLFLENSKNIHNQVESVVSSPIDLSNIDNPTLTFYVAHASNTGTYGGSSKFSVEFSGDCGNTWRRMYFQVSSGIAAGKTASGSYTPSSKSDWEFISISGFNSNDKVENGLIRISVENTDDNNFYIDNINLRGTFMDIPVLEFPRNGMDSVSSSVYLDWKAVPSIDFYEYELSESPIFSNLVSTGTNNYMNAMPNNDDSRFLAQGLTNGRTYYWRVRAIRGSLVSAWSDVWSFTVSADGLGHEFIDGGSAVSVEQFVYDESQFEMYPNPTNGSVFIDLGENIEAAELNVFSLQGQLVWNKELKETSTATINEGELTSGIYLVNITIGSSNVSKKLVVQ